jgi:hypothetical protein
MTTTSHKFSPSVNIVRDREADFNYIQTTNSNLIYKQITDSYTTGAKRSFSIIGSYGTGKSAFLWALQQTLSGKENHFNSSSLLANTLPAFDFLPLIGEHDSFMSVIADHLNLEKDASAKKIFSRLDEYYQNITNQSSL